MKKLLNLVATFFFIIGFVAVNANAAEEGIKPSATFTLEIEALTMYSGDTSLPVSKGVITFKGKEYPFTVQALTMGNRFGSSTLKATGVIYGMDDISQFESPFCVLGGGIHPGPGRQIVTTKNNNGVISVLDATLNGPLWAPATGVVVKLLNK